MNQGQTTMEGFAARLDGARAVMYDPDGYLLAWFGGHGIHVYDATAGVEVGYWTTGDFAQNDASYEEIVESMTEHRMSDEAYPS